MIRAAALLTLATLTSACTANPAPKDGEKAVAADTAEDTADAVKAEKKTIEEAAEAAVKLVEEESREEIEGLAPTDAQ